MQHQYLQKHAPYGAAPASPRSEKALYDVLNTFANKNPDNLRARDDHENRSIGQHPHMNFDTSGSMSPRSKKAMSMVSDFGRHYKGELDASAKHELGAYTALQEHAERINKKRPSIPFSTSEQMEYAASVRKKMKT